MEAETKPRTATPSRADESDAYLVERAREGDGRAFQVLYRRYARFVACVAYRQMGDNSEVDDIVQDCFVALAEGLARIKEPDRVKGWLAIVASRNVRRRLARRSRNRLLRRVWAGLTRSRETEEEERMNALYCSVSRLPVDLRVPWVLHRFEGETLPEVARLCGTSLTTVKRRISRADERLRRRLGHG